MKIKTISYYQSRESVNAAGLKEWKKIGVEIEVEENEQTVNDWNGVYEAAKQIVECWHKESNSSYYFQQEEIPVIQSKDR